MKKQLLILLSLTVLFPSGVSFSHLFSSHEHKVCADHGDGHYHETNNDCAYFQFRHNVNFLSENPSFSINIFSEVSEHYTTSYYFLPQQTPSSYFLRGPPA